MALPTNGRVVIETTKGDIDIELWSRETPKACRNFLALAMEGYYDNVIFHRIIPSFLVQTGDKTGTGQGGESFYGDPFEDEIHPRLRFAHRGLVGMANNGTKNSNDSQFFVTLDRAEELNGKHTLFGRCVGDTVFNVLKIGEVELVGGTERPFYPPKIKTIRILENPFPDIVPRITAAERRAQKKAQEDAVREREEELRRRSAKKNVKLLSFDDDPEEAESGPKKAIVRPDLIQESTPSMPDFVRGPSHPTTAPTASTGSTTSKKTEDDITKIREKHAKEQAAASSTLKSSIQKMESQIRKRTTGNASDGDSDSDSGKKKKKPKKSYLQEELAKYSKGLGLHSKKGKDKDTGRRRGDEGDVIRQMDLFRGMLRSGGGLAETLPEEEKEGEGEGEEGTMEIDTDTGFLSHSLQFPKDDGEESRKAERDYEVIDPRQRSARAREEERERKGRARGRGGRR